MDSCVQGGADRKKAIFSLVLIVFLLYNPFFTILSSSLELSVKHPLSYRATVASAELRRCTVETEKPLIPALVTVFLLAGGLERSSEAALIQPDEFVPAFMAASDDIWFRPPPSA